MWIALGFIPPSSDLREIGKDIGEEYFDILVKKLSFDKGDNCYKMHDLLHGWTWFVSAQECLRVADYGEALAQIFKNWKAKLSSFTRWIYVKNENGFRIVELEHMNELHRLNKKGVGGEERSNFFEM
ncbi:hypothetical protein IEQ34_016704 [Dendrobium chrysotoxum]|uniref:Disease resistance protein winged helix domain-containing protein n=1 Tax=Dendrobium chrysotoxum TaxID=161865 RepID=A0AAV7GEY7_DENCH|nr:hypothetical protein IEQ34_016704 [Dendrobium chrysotoxum]